MHKGLNNIVCETLFMKYWVAVKNHDLISLTPVNMLWEIL